MFNLKYQNPSIFGLEKKSTKNCQRYPYLWKITYVANFLKYTYVKIEMNNESSTLRKRQRENDKKREREI